MEGCGSIESQGNQTEAYVRNNVAATKEDDDLDVFVKESDATLNVTQAPIREDAQTALRRQTTLQQSSRSREGRSVDKCPRFATHMLVSERNWKAEGDPVAAGGRETSGCHPPHAIDAAGLPRWWHTLSSRFDGPYRMELDR